MKKGFDSIKLSSLQMANAFEPMENGWVRSDCLHLQGFAAWFWKALQHFGYSEPPMYEGLEVEEHGHTSCTVNVLVPANVSVEPNWEAWTVSVTGSTLDESWDHAAISALTKFCEDHKEDIAGTPFAYVPIRDQSDETWRFRVDSLFERHLPTYDPIAAAMVSYAALMFNKYSDQRIELTVSRGVTRDVREEN